MFGLKSKIRADELEEVREEIKNLRVAKRKAEEELEELKFKKRLEQEEIVHLQKINKEKLEQEVTGKKIELEKKYAEDISKFKEQQRVELVKSLKEFHEKIEKRFGDELSNLKEVYGLLMARLPNVNLTLEKKLR
jgi:hypothetical protein